jgi:membrane associated rhomboid family serine protease
MFTLPIYDDNPTRGNELVNWLLIAACVLVFLWQFSLNDQAEMRAVLGLGLVPAVLTGKAELAPALYVVPAPLTVLTSMFLHGGWMHLIGNMLYLWIFGNNVEDAMGHGRYLVFYLLCGIAAALAQTIADPGSRLPMVGASGAIAGVLGAYLLLHPRANVGVLLVILIYIRVIAVPAVIVLGLWFAMQLWDGAHTPTDKGGVAYMAHIGGFIAGMVLVPFFKRPWVPLFGAAHSRAFSVTRRPGHLPPPLG